MTIVLRGLTWDHVRGYGPLRATASIYAEQHGIHVTWDARSLKDFGDAPIDTLAEHYDLLIIDHPHVGMAAASGCILPLDAYIAPDILATLAAQSAGPSHTSYYYAGHQWALAIDAAVQTSAYRPDLMPAPLPANWDAVLELGRTLQPNGQYIGMPLCPTDAICSFLSLCASLGNPPGQEGGGLVQPEIGLRALLWLAEMRQIGHPDSLSWNPILMLDYMSQHDDLVYCPLTFCYTNYARSGFRAHLVMFHNIPGVRGALLGGTGFAVSSRCATPELAVAYGVWLCSAETQRTLYVEYGGQPGNIVAWQDEAANQLTHNFFRNTLDTLQTAYVRPRHNGFVAFQEAAGNLIHAYLRDMTDPQVCLDQINTLYQSSFRDVEDTRH